MRTYEQIQAELAAHKQLQAARPIREAAAAESAAPYQDNAEKTWQAEAALRGGMQGITLGASDEIQAGLSTAAKVAMGKNASYEKELEATRAREKLAAQEWPKTALASNVAGGIATSFIPGLNAAKSASVLGAIGKTAAIGATAGFLGGEGADDRISKAQIGGALGGALGAAGQALSKGAGALANQDDAAMAVAKSVIPKGALDVGKTYANGLADDVARLTGHSPKFTAEQGLQQFGKDLIKGGYVKAGQSVYEAKAKVVNDLDEAGQALGGFLRELDSRVPEGLIDPAKVFSSLQKTLGKTIRGAGDRLKVQQSAKALPGSLLEDNAAANKVVDAVQPYLRSFARDYLQPLQNGQAPRMTLAQLNTWRASLAKEIYDRGISSPAAKSALQTLERTIMNNIDDALYAAGKRIGNSGQDGKRYLAIFQQLKRQNQFLQLASSSLDDAIQRTDNLVQGAGVAAISSSLGALGGFALSGGNPLGVATGAAITATAAPTVISKAIPAAAAFRMGAANALNTAPAQAIGNNAGRVGQGVLQSLFTAQ